MTVRRVVSTFVLLTSAVLAQATVAGPWDLQMNWSGAVSTGSCVFVQDGDTLRGTCGGGNDRFPVSGRVTGRKLSWRVDVKQGGAEGRMEFEGEIDERGAAISGTCAIGDQAGSFRMKKQ